MEPILKEIQAKHDIRHAMAIDRTVMANERTLLSYANTSLALLVPGVSFLHFTDSVILGMIGVLFIPLSLMVFFWGFVRYRKKKKVINEERKMLQQMLQSEYCSTNVEQIDG
ncbi:DUF202 domain-containing protein [Cytophagaceae bacterium ABcell3]|nr:DUF202 domain-containing protein [Cytophagaceae bacterium ABcell3]